MRKFTRQPLTDRQKSLVARCKKAGHGWAAFASNVEAQGWCSPKQEDTLCTMTQRIDLAEARKAGHFKTFGKHDISDGEAMSFGVFF